MTCVLGSRHGRDKGTRTEVIPQHRCAQPREQQSQGYLQRHHPAMGHAAARPILSVSHAAPLCCPSWLACLKYHAQPPAACQRRGPIRRLAVRDTSPRERHATPSHLARTIYALIQTRRHVRTCDRRPLQHNHLAGVPRSLSPKHH